MQTPNPTSLERQTATTFLLGVGCAKGGTTWLHDYLTRHPQVAAGFAKEYNVLSTHFMEHFRAIQVVRMAENKALIAAVQRSKDPRRDSRLRPLRERLALRERLFALSHDLGNYVAYFRDLAHRDHATRLVCDISPLYYAVPAPALSEAGDRLSEAGFDVRVVFVMRDPVERTFSNYRFAESKEDRAATISASRRLTSKLSHAEKRIGRTVGQLRHALAPTRESKIRSSRFLHFALEPVNLHLSQYERTIREVEQAFPADKIHYAFYETLFSDECLRRFTEFAGLDFVPGSYGTRKNVTAIKSEMSNFEISLLRNKLADTYDFCAERFGRGFIEANWRYA